MKYKLFYGVLDLTSDQSEEFVMFRFFHRVKSDAEAIKKAREFIRKEARFEHNTGGTSTIYFKQLVKVSKNRNGREVLVPISISD